MSDGFLSEFANGRHEMETRGQRRGEPCSPCLIAVSLSLFPQRLLTHWIFIFQHHRAAASFTSGFSSIGSELLGLEDRASCPSLWILITPTFSWKTTFQKLTMVVSWQYFFFFSFCERIYVCVLIFKISIYSL